MRDNVGKVSILYFEQNIISFFYNYSFLIYLIFNSQFGGLKCFAVLLLMIATSQGRKLYGRAKAVEAEPGIKTHTWGNIKDYNPQVFQEGNDEEHYDSFNLADERSKRPCSIQATCGILTEAMKKVSNEPEKQRDICRSNGGKCDCRSHTRNGNCDVCDEIRK